MVVIWLKGLVLARNDFGRAKINVLDNAVVIEKDICERSRLVGPRAISVAGG